VASNAMPTHEEHILRILGEATEPLFPSEIADRLTVELGSGIAFTMAEVVLRLKRTAGLVEQSDDGRWTLKRRASVWEFWPISSNMSTSQNHHRASKKRPASHRRKQLREHALVSGHSGNGRRDPIRRNQICDAQQHTNQSAGVLFFVRYRQSSLQSFKGKSIARAVPRSPFLANFRVADDSLGTTVWFPQRRC